MQLPEKQIVYYNTIRAENFIENLQDLWETNSFGLVKLEQHIKQDWLYYAVQMCNDRLPPKLPTLSETLRDTFGPDKSISFALFQVTFSKHLTIKNKKCHLNQLYFIFQEYNLFNENIELVRRHLENLEKYILLNTEMFPNEWKKIALSLQSQRVPDEWETASSRPSIHTLKSWIKCSF